MTCGTRREGRARRTLRLVSSQPGSAGARPGTAWFSPSGAADAALAAAPAGPRLLVVTAASNVTGELWPVAELTRVARGARRPDRGGRRAACPAPSGQHG